MAPRGMLNHPIRLLLALFGLVWLAGWLDWLWRGDPGVLHAIIFGLTLPLGLFGIWKTTRLRQTRPILCAAVLCVIAILWAHLLVFAADQFGWYEFRVHAARLGTAAVFAIGLGWVIWGIERLSQHYERERPEYLPDLGPDLRSTLITGMVFAPALIIRSRHRPRPIRIVSLVLIGLWTWAVAAIAVILVSTFAAHFGIPVIIGAAALVGCIVVLLTVSVWRFIHQQSARRAAAAGTAGDAGSDGSATAVYIWNPLNPDAWYYGRHGRRLNQSLTVLMSYCMLFFAGFLLLTQTGGCEKIYEMPAGGGEQQQITQVVKIQKVIKKKYVINPFSSIRFKVPPIDEVKLQLTEATKHRYTVGYGQGAGAGFAGGTNRGKVRFIRLEYDGGDWNQDFGVGADQNILIEYGIRTRQKVAARTESLRIAELADFPIGKSPPMMYLTGQKNISTSKNDDKVLREYLLDKHGMLFGDNGGSGQFHSQFLAMMRRVLPNVDPHVIPLDDRIHRIPFQIPFLPYVAPHGGTEALGWRVDGRLVCYYHPGDIGDAWADQHAGVKPEVWEACYQLGTNVIFYAHTEYSKWLMARQENE